MKTILLVLLLATAIYAAEKISLSGRVHQFLKNKLHKKPEVTPVVAETSGFSDDVQAGWTKAKEGAQKLSTTAIEDAKKFGTVVSDKFSQLHNYLKNKFTSKKPEATETSGFGFADFIKSPHHHHKWNQTLNHTKNSTKNSFHHHAQKALDWVKGIFGHHNKSNHTFNHSQWNHSHHHHNHTRLVEESGVLVQAKNFLAAQGKKIYEKIKSFGKKPEAPEPAPAPESSGVVTDNLIQIKDSAKEIAAAIKDKIKRGIEHVKKHFKKPEPEASGFNEFATDASAKAKVIAGKAQEFATDASAKAKLFAGNFKDFATDALNKAKVVVGKVVEKVKGLVNKKEDKPAETSGMGGEAYRNYVSHGGKW